MQDRPASAFVQDCITPLEPNHRNPKTHGSRNTRRTTRRTNCEEHPNARLLPNNNNQHTASKHRALRAVLECIRAPEYESTRAERQHGRKMMKAGPRTDSSTAARTAGPTSNSPQERPCSPKWSCPVRKRRERGTVACRNLALWCARGLSVCMLQIMCFSASVRHFCLSELLYRTAVPGIILRIVLFFWFEFWTLYHTVLL